MKSVSNQKSGWGYQVNVSKAFRDRADTAAFMEAWVGMVLSRNGLHVLLHPFTYNDGKDHTHSWDLDVCQDRQLEYPVACEVKSTSHRFTGESDFQDMSGPNTAFICSAGSYSKKYQNSPYTVREWLMVSKQTGSVVWVPAGSEVMFTEIVDPQRGPFNGVVVRKGKLRSIVEFVEMVNGR